VAVILGVIFVISGYMHAADTRGSAQPSAAHFAAGRGELVQRADGPSEALHNGTATMEVTRGR